MHIPTYVSLPQEDININITHIFTESHGIKGQEEIGGIFLFMSGFFAYVGSSLNCGKLNNNP